MIEPAFEIRHADGSAQRIWPDGRVEGFGPSPVIINRIPAIVNAAIAGERVRQERAASRAMRKVSDPIASAR